jgi:hypothetical protein
MQRAYRMLLRLYPPDYRVEFADEMLAVFAQHAAERRAQGLPDYVKFLLHEYIGVLVNALREQPAWLHFVPVVGGVSVAALLHMAIYVLIFKLFDVVSRAIGHVSFSTQEPISPFIALTLCVTTLLGLLPLLFLLNMRLLQRQR